MNCPACGAPITDDARFCSYCGAKLPDNTQRIEIRSEIKIEDTAKLEEVKRKYELEEKKHIDNNNTNKSELKKLKVKLWVSWLICIISLCIAMTIYNPIPIKDSPFSTPCFILFFASGIYAIILSFGYLFKKIKHKK